MTQWRLRTIPSADRLKTKNCPTRCVKLTRPGGWVNPLRESVCFVWPPAGGRQSSLYCAAGAEVTVVDLSGAMLELDRRVAAERGFSLRLIEASMDDLSMLQNDEFDIVIQPVSTCYVADVRPVFAEVARVLRSDGLYVSQHKQPVSLQAGIDPSRDGGYLIEHRYYRDRPVPPPSNPSAAARRLRESGAIEFVHRWGTTDRRNLSVRIRDRGLIGTSSRKKGRRRRIVRRPRDVHRPLRSHQSTTE